MESVKSILIKRDNMDPEDADILIQEFREELDDLIAEGDVEGAYDLIQDKFGLEPDFLDQFLPLV